MAFSRSSLTHTQADTPDPKVHQAKTAIINHQKLHKHNAAHINREVADLAVAWTTRPPNHENYMNTTLLSLLNREDPYLSVVWTTQLPDHRNYINTTYHEPGGGRFVGPLTQHREVADLWSSTTKWVACHQT